MGNTLREVKKFLWESTFEDGNDRAGTANLLLKTAVVEPHFDLSHDLNQRHAGDDHIQPSALGECASHGVGINGVNHGSLECRGNLLGRAASAMVCNASDEVSTP